MPPKRSQEEIYETEEVQVEKPIRIDQTDTWRNRRRMAYFSLFSIVVVTYWALFVVPENRLKVLEEIITWFFFIMGSVVGAYMGFSAYEKKWNNNK